MSKVTQNKILNMLNNFSHPGGPYFPPRELRQVALKASQDLFPEGCNERMLAHQIFRILHPWYAIQSIIYHVFTFLYEVYDAIFENLAGVRLKNLKRD